MESTRFSGATSPKVNTYIPSVVKKMPDGSERGFDIYSRLLDDRIIMFTEEVNSVSASNAVAELLYLNSVDKKKPIWMYIDSPGGVVTAGLSIYDTMKSIDAPVYTMVTGLAASMGAILLSGGDKRFALPNAEVMIHQPSGGAQGKATDINIVAENILKTKKRLNTILAENCHKDYDKVAADTERDYYMDAEEALAYGIIDEIFPYKKKTV